MKKTLIILAIISLTTNLSFASNSFGSAVKNAVKQDIANTKSAVKSDVKTVKNAVKQDIDNQKQAQATTAAIKKEQKLKQINTKLTDLNKEMTTVKEDKNITETERTLRVKTLQKQIDFYNSQKKALQ